MSGVIGGIAAAVVLSLLQRAGRSSVAGLDPADGARVARYPLATRILAWFLIAGGAALCFVAMKASANAIVGLAICLAILTAVIALLLEFTFARASWTDKWVVLNSPWRSVRRLAWTEIDEVRFSQAAGWFVLRGRSGVVIRLSMYLGGLTELLSELRQQVAPALMPKVDEAIFKCHARSR